MEKIIDKEKYNKEDLLQIEYYYLDNFDQFVNLDERIIVKVYNFLLEEKSESELLIKYIEYVNQVGFDAGYLFNEEELGLYLKIYRICEQINYINFNLNKGLISYYENINSLKTYSIYEKTFTYGFDLYNNYEYFDCLEKYLDIYKGDKVKLLKHLIEYSPKENEGSIDTCYTYLYYINLSTNEGDRLQCIEEEIRLAKSLVEHEREHNSEVDWSDSEEERCLCEGLSLLMEYYLSNKDYQKVMDTYWELTEEIRKSDCVRYYHIRDKIYYEMLIELSNVKREFKFFKDLKNDTYLCHTSIKDLSLFVNKEITLYNTSGEVCDFVLKSIFDEKYLIVVPIISMFENNGYISLEAIKIKDNIYFVTK